MQLLSFTGTSPLCLAVALGLSAGCSSAPETIRADVEMLVVQEGEQSRVAADRVIRHGRRALPAIESALHTAPPAGRKNLIVAMRRLGDGEAVPLLRHIALFDDAEDVRKEAEWTLSMWAAGHDERGEKARAALRELDERRGREAAG